MKLISLAFVLLFLNFSCNRIREISFTQPAKGKCSIDSDNIYHYILPKQNNNNLPLLIILDSGGDGLMAIKKTLPALSQIPCMIVGSDLIRNNFPDFERAIDILIKDVCQKFPVEKDQVVIAGFSGGARMAFEYARKHHVKGVLMCGAGPSMNSNEELPCPIWIIAGTCDFNFQETYYNPLNGPLQRGYLADYFSGTHEWPPAELMKEAYLYLMRKSIPGGKRLLKQESDLLSKKADSLLLHSGSTFFALKAVEKAILLNPGNRQAIKQFQKIILNPEFSEKINKIESDLQQESRIIQAYSQASLKRDSLWWAKEFHNLSQLITKSKDEQKDHFLRIKGFLGIMFYSRLNTLIRTQPENPQTVHLLAAYRMAEPENPDVYYDYALYELKTGKENQSRVSLKKSISLGFGDSIKLASDFPTVFLNEIKSGKN